MSKRIPLRESSSFQLSNNSKVILKSDNKKLIENINSDINSDIALKISPENPFSCLAIIKDIPVTRYTLNANNRIYPKELWEKVYQKGSAERTWCHKNHSSDDGNVGDYLGVWHNFRLLEDKCIADLFLMENEIGKSLLSGLQCGGPVHFSTFGYGEFLYENGVETNIVDPDCYELVRLSDWVAISSQNVITTIDENAVGIQKKVESISTLTENKNEILENTFTNKDYNKMENNKMQDQHTNMDYWRNRTKTAIKESVEFLSANKFEDAFKTLNEVKSNIPKDESYKQFQEKIEDQIFSVESKKTESLKNLESQYANIVAENKTMKEQIDSLTQLVQGAAKKLKEQDEMPMMEPEADVATLEATVDQVSQAVDQLASVIDAKETVIEDLNDQIATLESQVMEAESETQAVVSAAEEKVIELGSKVQDLTAQVAVMESKLNQAQKLKEEMTSSDLSNTPENPVGINFKKPEELLPQYGDSSGIDTITDEEDVSLYVDEVIQDDPMLRENKVHLIASKNRKAVDRKIQNLKAVKEEKSASERNFLAESAASAFNHLQIR